MCNSLFNSALPDSRSRCHVAYSNVSWLEISELPQTDGFAGGYVSLVDSMIIIIAITLTTATIIYSFGGLAATIFG